MNIKDIPEKRHNEDGELVGFTIDLSVENVRGQETTVSFRFTKKREKMWNISVVLDDRENGFQPQGYSINYMVPQNNMTVQQIIGIGLVEFHYDLQTELQFKESLSYQISDIIPKRG